MTDEELRQAQTALIAAQIWKMEFDMNHARDQAGWDLRKFIITTVVSAVLAMAAAVGAGIAIGNYFTKQPPAPIIIQVPGPAK
jgi:hypothetical protein